MGPPKGQREREPEREQAKEAPESAERGTEQVSAQAQGSTLAMGRGISPHRAAGRKP